MIKNNKPVKRLERTVVVKKNYGNYVYFTEKVEYKPELKRSVPKRIAIGKLNEDGMLIPNENYFDIFGTADKKHQCGIEDDLYQQLLSVSQKENKSIDEVVEIAVKEYLQQYRK